MRIKIYTLAIFCITVLYANSLFSQDLFRNFYHISRNTGLSQSTINSIICDSNGYMWFATNDGLNRYNAYDLQYFKHNPQDTNSLGLGRVNCTFIDSTGRLWVGTDQGGLNLFNAEKENFVRYTHQQLNPASILSNDIREIIANKAGEFYLACYGGGVSVFNPATGKSRSILLSNNNITCLAYDADGNLLAGTSTGVEIIVGAYNGIQTASIKQLERLNNIPINRIYKDSRGFIWFGTFSFGAFCYNPQTQEWTHFIDSGKPETRISHNIIRAFSEDANHTILIGTGGGGINLISNQLVVKETIVNQVNNINSLGSNIIYSLFRDKNNNLWIGTYNTGVDVIFDTKDKFKHIRSYGNPNSLSNNAVLAIQNGDDGILWIGTDGGGLNKYNPAKGTYEHFKHNPNIENSISGNVAKSLYLDKKGVLWIGTFNSGLNALNTKTGKFRKYHYSLSNPNCLSSNHIWDIAEDERGNLWLAMLNGGLDCLDPATNRITHYKHDPSDPESLPVNNVSVVEIDSKGNIWIGTEYGGISVMKNGREGRFQNFQQKDYEGNKISSNQICSIFEDSFGLIWIGTLGGGINLYNEKSNKLKVINEKDGLASNLVYAFLEDENGNLWISTNNGLSKYFRTPDMVENPKFQNYDLNDGLQSNEFSPQSACISPSGEMFFGGINGFTAFLPNSIKLNTSKPKLVITDFRIFNKSMEVDKEGSPLTKSLSLTKSIKLSYSQSVITFEFAALNYVVPSKNRYKYRLTGFESSWNDVGTQRTATYTNLNPGRYIFKVIGSNNDGVWNEEGVSVELIITPPYYKTWIFRIALVLIFILGIYLLYKWRLYEFEVQQRKLRKMVDKRTSELLSLNKLLELQNSEIASQKENLEKVNKELEAKQVQIQNQNEELGLHRHHLEEIVAQRTTELERAKIKAEESERLKMAFLSNMSHEIRTPMNAIIGFSSLLEEQETTEEERKEFTRLITTNGESLLVLIDDILELSRIEANQIELTPRAFNLNTFINDLFISFSKLKATGKNFTFSLNSNISPDRIAFMDDRRLRQILMNLLDNAFKFTEIGSVELQVTEKEDFFTFSVIDTGIGIPERALSTIFDRFRKGDESNSQFYRGAGLGLTISKHLAELLKGKIEVESTVNIGSKFSLIIPVHQSEAALTGSKSINYNEMNSSETIDFSGLTILIAEDEVDSYTFLAKLLKLHKIQSIWAKHGEEAVEMNRIYKPAIILMDIKMPVMDGYQALQLIKSETPETIVIAQTAFARSEEEHRIRNAGFDDYISKPLNSKLLFNILDRFYKA